ncbi:hypothetical protein HMPREF0322_01587 [Desulfitobacterium hafniense DP7]|uniref:Uncharacterized protein n=1 Tax=Desulfitobacterium hafniense DP7 TaxID=537010 RepID=G9XKX6_DESHA|nr:hypothetical protein HMPREF0322_01587 [Desulfitobacterium hafniense DP7]
MNEVRAKTVGNSRKLGIIRQGKAALRVERQGHAFKTGHRRGAKTGETGRLPFILGSKKEVFCLPVFQIIP